VLDGFSEDLVAATDEEVMTATASLEMNALMKGSAAFFGMKGPHAPYREGLFDDPELSEDRVIEAVLAWRRARKEDVPK
jgi:hypothetical protein